MSLFEAANEGKSFFEPGNYIAQLVNIVPAENSNPEWGPQVKWSFYMAPFPGDADDQIVQNDGETLAELWQFSSTKMSPQAKARQWAEALLGRKMEDGETLDLSAIKGAYAIVTLTDEVGKDGKTRSKIAGIKPYDPDAVAARPAVRTRKSTPAAERDTEPLPF